MRRSLEVISVLAGLMCMTVIVSGQKVYLSPSGNDSNPGTADKPVATLSAARDLSRSLRKKNPDQPVEIIALKGEYLMLQPFQLTSDDSGTETSPLIIRSEDGARALFRGGIRVTGWEKAGPNLWKAFIPQVAFYDSYFEQLYVNGRRAIRARTPNEGFSQVRNLTETVIYKGTGRSPELAVQKVSLDSREAADIASFSQNDYRDALVIFYHNWDNTRKRIAGYSKEDSTVFISGEGMKPWNPINSKSRYILENYSKALDVPREWYLDRTGWLWYIPLEGETPENTFIYAPVIKEFVTIQGNPATGEKTRNIRFENIDFEIAGYRTPPEGNEPAQAAAPVEAVVTLDYAEGISFNNCSVAHTGTYAFWFRRAVNDCTVDHCLMHDLGAGGVKIGETTLRDDPSDLTKAITVNNCSITDAGYIFPCAVGVILFHTSDNRITHNEISNLRYSGISVGWIWGYAPSPSKRNIISWNHIHHLGWGELCDMGGVYTLGASEGTVVSNNLIHHVYSYDYGGWGLYTDEGSYGIVMENNLVYKCKNSGFHQHYGKENIIRNNIFAFNIRSQLQATRIEEHRSLSFTNNIIYYDRGTLLSSNWHKFNFLAGNNCYWDTRTKDVRFGDMSFQEWQKSGKDINSMVSDPQFSDPASFDFTFKNSSVIRKINFKPFSYSEAGVYGDDEWKARAILDMDLAKAFDEIIMLRESSR